MKKKYKSCNHIRHGLCFYEDKVVSCCYSPVDQINGQVPPSLYDEYKGEILTKDELFNRIDKFADIFKKGGTPIQCKGCFKIEEKEWDESENRKYIDFVTVTHYSNCNANCIYCSNNLTPEQRCNDKYYVLPILKKLKDEGVLKKGFELHLGGGEFSIYEECDGLLEEFALTNYAKVSIATSAIKYVENIFKSLDCGSTIMVVSLDSGCRETYKQIKRVDAFENVIETLKKYSSTNKARESITLKYIIIPTINDNMEEFRKFLNIAKELGIKYISIDIEARYSRSVNHDIDYYFYELAQKMREEAINLDCFNNIYLHSFLQQNKEILAKYANNPLKKLINRIRTKLSGKKFKKLYSSYKY